MRPIHLAGGRQRDLYGPVISHRSSICIFMALSSYKGGEGAGRIGGAGEERTVGDFPPFLNPRFQLDEDPHWFP